MENEFGINNIPIKSYRFPNMYLMPKMHKNLIKAILIIVSPELSVIPVRTITSVFRLFVRQIQKYNDKYRFATDVNTFWVKQNNRTTVFLWGLIKLLFCHFILIFLWKQVDKQTKEGWPNKTKKTFYYL